MQLVGIMLPLDDGAGNVVACSAKQSCLLFTDLTEQEAAVYLHACVHLRRWCHTPAGTGASPRERSWKTRAQRTSFCFR